MWKHTLSIIIAVVIAAISPALTIASQTISAPLAKVTVFPSQAQVTRVAKLDLAIGEHSILVEDIPELADVESFRVSVAGVEGITILGLKHWEVYHMEAPLKRVAELETEIEHTERSVKQAISDRLDAFDKQKRLLTTMSQETGENMTGELKAGAFDVEQWESAYIFLGEKIKLVNDSIRAVSREMKDAERLLKKLNAELEDIQDSGERGTNTVQLDLYLDRRGEVTIALTYTIFRACWVPIYDARLNASGDSVELSYFAEISQKTGEDWNDVEIELSTSTPSRGTGPGKIKPKFLTIYRSSCESDLVVAATVGVVKRYGALQIRGGQSGEISYVVDGVADKYPLGALGYWRASGIVESRFSTMFKITRRDSIPSGDRSVRVQIGRWQLDASVAQICRPSNNLSVFRVATITNQESAPLLPGSIALFAESNFLGNVSMSQFVATGQSFELPFGIDNSITVEREIIKQKRDRDEKKERVEQTIKITLANHASDSCTVRLEESIPTSQDDRIKVKTRNIEPEPSSIDVKGIASWKAALAGGEEKTFVIPYRIESPVGLVITGM